MPSFVPPFQRTDEVDEHVSIVTSTPGADGDELDSHKAVGVDLSLQLGLQHLSTEDRSCRSVVGVPVDSTLDETVVIRLNYEGNHIAFAECDIVVGRIHIELVSPLPTVLHRHPVTLFAVDHASGPDIEPDGERGLAREAIDELANLAAGVVSDE